MPCGLQQCGILTCIDSDEHVQPPLTLIEYSSDKQRL